MNDNNVIDDTEVLQESGDSQEPLAPQEPAPTEEPGEDEVPAQAGEPGHGETVTARSTEAEGEAPHRSKREAALDNEGEIAADYLEELLDIADLDGDIDTYSEGGRAHVSVLTKASLLVGKDGEVLEALQELARLAVMTETGHRSRLMLDIAGHRDKRRKVLQELAGVAIAEVKESGEAVRLAPMNPFERKIVHDAVAQAGLVSESEGEEPRRRVVVLPKE